MPYDKYNLNGIYMYHAWPTIDMALGMNMSNIGSCISLKKLDMVLTKLGYHFVFGHFKFYMFLNVLW